MWNHVVFLSHSNLVRLVHNLGVMRICGGLTCVALHREGIITVTDKSCWQALQAFMDRFWSKSCQDSALSRVLGF